ncbi:MAG: hypothetical protein H6R14_1453 [Proteobacteria bacterium]|nr:hypothetical protein [Pseudomonadota bacterium]
MENEMPNGSIQKRRAERRVCTRVTPPPYQTSAGVVMTDRRSSFDRRATWIREYSLETVPGRDS